MPTRDSHTDEEHTPPPSSPPTRRWMDTGPDDTGQHKVPHQPEGVAERALRIALENRKAIGMEPNPMRGFEGSGVWKYIGVLHAQATGIQDSIDKVLSEMAKKDAVTNKHNNWMGRLAWKVIETIVPIVVMCVLAYLAGFRRVPELAPTVTPVTMPAKP